jgi:hypothetical protein
MSISKDLFLAILSMDAYNRGYGAGLTNEDVGAQGGLGETGQLGNATLLTRASLGLDDQAYQNWQAAGFYALAYQWNGETVIAYRGTDNADWTTLGDGASDLWQGWTVGLGFAPASQAGLAIDFYEAVTGRSVHDGAAAGTILTGHSLGGGLAGFVAAAQAWA